MIVIGVLLLALATWQHRQRMELLRAQYTDAPLSLSLVAGTLITILGWSRSSQQCFEFRHKPTNNTERTKKPCISPMTHFSPKISHH